MVLKGNFSIYNYSNIDSYTSSGLVSNSETVCYYYNDFIDLIPKSKAQVFFV